MRGARATSWTTGDLLDLRRHRRLDGADDHVLTALPPAPPLVEHLEALADAGHPGDHLAPIRVLVIRAAFDAEELDTFLPDSVPEGYPAIQRGIAYLGPGRDGSAGYGRDANYWVSSWFELPDNAFAIVYGLDHAATGKATYSSAAVYLDKTVTAGVSDVNSADFAANPLTAGSYVPGGQGIEKFYVWKVARNCNGEPACMEAKVTKSACIENQKITPEAPVCIGMRQYAEPATKVGPTEAELLYDRVIVFRRK